VQRPKSGIIAPAAADRQGRFRVRAGWLQAALLCDAEPADSRSHAVRGSRSRRGRRQPPQFQFTAAGGRRCRPGRGPRTWWTVPRIPSPTRFATRYAQRLTTWSADAWLRLVLAILATWRPLRWTRRARSRTARLRQGSPESPRR